MGNDTQVNATTPMKTKPKTKSKALPPVATLRRILSYDPDTGILRWKVRMSSRSTPGEQAGSITVNGYRVIKIKGSIYCAHRIAILMATGQRPSIHVEVDHINGDRDDNRLCNLRLVHTSQNLCNAKRRVDNSTGCKGVSLCRDTGLFTARVAVNGKRHWIGRFGTLREARAAIRAARQELHGEFANHGKDRPGLLA